MYKLNTLSLGFGGFNSYVKNPANSCTKSEACRTSHLATTLAIDSRPRQRKGDNAATALNNLLGVLTMATAAAEICL
ncbi:hypothetical protein ACHAXS_008176 [Conticribra weissflogii]